MKKSLVSIAALSVALIAGCSDSPEDKVYGPGDYKHFSSYFSMDESTKNEMSADGGTPLVPPAAKDPNAAILTADALPGDTTASALIAKPKDSPAIDLAN